jgi:hypothetical protein
MAMVKMTAVIIKHDAYMASPAVFCIQPLPFRKLY